MLGSASMMATAPCAPTVIPYSRSVGPRGFVGAAARPGSENRTAGGVRSGEKMFAAMMASDLGAGRVLVGAASGWASAGTDRKSTRLNSSHSQISYAVFCLKKQKHVYSNQKRDGIRRDHRMHGAGTLEVAHVIKRFPAPYRHEFELDAPVYSHH